MLLAAIDATHGQTLIATRDPDTRLTIARDAVAQSPIPTLALTDPVSANFLILFLCATEPALAATLTGHPLTHAAVDFPLRAVAPTETHTLAGQLENIVPLDLDHYLQQFAADPPPDAPTCRAVRDLFTRLIGLYRAAADQHLGILALPD